MKLTLRIELQETKDPIKWRKVEVNGDYTFTDLHMIIQVLFDLLNSHLYHFAPRGWSSYPCIQFYHSDLDQEEPEPPMTFPLGDYYDADQIQIGNYFNKNRKKIKYIYDYGDDWTFLITLKDLQENVKVISPRCLSGKGNGVMEDCGGVPGYYYMMEAIQDPKHPEHEDYREWLGLDKNDTYDPDHFDLRLRNEHLKAWWDEYQSHRE